MASFSSSSSSFCTRRRFNVFPSFHGPDVRDRFLSHLRYQFKSDGITMFNDQEIERGHTIGLELVKAIRGSKLSIVTLSKNYASSSWCLGELVEILKCKEDSGQIVMTIFYDVDPSDVRKQRGDFGSAFEKLCQGRTEEEKQRWSQALAYVATIAGEASGHCLNDAEMTTKISATVSKKLNPTLWRDFPGMVGLQVHLTKLESMLCLERDEVRMIGICGPTGIGKTTIARALNQLSTDFTLSYFKGNLKGITGIDDDYEASKLRLQNHNLSNILNDLLWGIGRYTLGAVKEGLQDQRVLIILDDVDDLKQLKVLATELSWFGSGSRIIVTSEDEKFLTEHGINDIYHVDFPSEKEALEIFCQSAFKQSSPSEGFEELAKHVAKVCGNLPLSLCVVGSSLRCESKPVWKLSLSRIENSLDRKVLDVLREGYDRLSKQNQSIFLHIACFFNNKVVGHVESILSDSTDSHVKDGLETLADKSLVHKSTDGRITMHYLLQQLGRQIVHEQSDEPEKRQFLEVAKEIRDVLANKKGTGFVIGISFDMSKINNFSISHGAFDGMCHLKFLRIHGGEATTFHIPENMKLPPHFSLFDQLFPPHLRLLDWDAYPRKRLHATFQPDHLVELHMQRSNLKELWGGSKPLPNLKKINLGFSFKLKEIPDLSNATNLETLTLTSCSSLVELPSSIRNLHKLKKLMMSSCVKLQVIPTNINLKSLEEVDMSDCSRLKSFPDISSNIKTLIVRDTKIKDVSPSISKRWSRLERLEIGSRRLKSLTHIPECVTLLDLSNSQIKKIPDRVRDLKHLVGLIVENCTKLVSIPALPPSLESLNANSCVSLTTVCCSFHNPIKQLTFYNCLKLDEESRRRIRRQDIQEYICLPGKQVPAEFTHKATRRSITISSGTFSATSRRFKACLLLSPIKDNRYLTISCSLRRKGGVTINNFCRSTRLSDLSPLSEHLFIFRGDLFPRRNRCLEVDVATSEITFEFSCWYFNAKQDKIIECGVHIFAEEEAETSRSSSKADNSETMTSSISSSKVDNSETKTISSSSSSSKVDNSETKTISISSSSKVDNSETKTISNSSSKMDNFETESSSSSEVDHYETGGNNKRNTDGDEEYEAEAFVVSQVENIKDIKHTSGWNWLEKLALNKTKTSTTLLGVLLVLCLFVINQISREIGIPDPRYY